MVAQYSRGDAESMIDAYFKGRNQARRYKRAQGMINVANAVMAIGIIILSYGAASHPSLLNTLSEAASTKLVAYGASIGLIGGVSGETIKKKGKLTLKDLLYTCGAEGDGSFQKWKGEITFDSKLCYAVPNEEP
ncbi:hypothetical protein [Leptospira wolbachii]|nr:hypothetical protein [Leptospira wolbachii]